MLRVTTPVTSSPSACRGDATSRAPNRSASYTGPNTAEISTSQPLQEPASTCRTCNEPLTPAGGSIAGCGAGSARSTTRPTRKILPIHPIPLPVTRSQVLEHRDAVAEHPGQNFARHHQQFRNVRRRDRIDHRVPVLAGDHHTRAAQHPQLLRQVRRLQPHLRQQFSDRPVPHRQQLKNPDPRRMTQSLDELTLQLVQRLRFHGSPEDFSVPMFDQLKKLLDPRGSYERWSRSSTTTDALRPTYRGSNCPRPKPGPLIDRRWPLVTRRRTGTAGITLLGVSAVVLAQRCRRFSWAGLEL